MENFTQDCEETLEVNQYINQIEALEASPDELQQAIQRVKDDLAVLCKAIVDALGPVVQQIYTSIADFPDFSKDFMLAMNQDLVVRAWLENKAPSRWRHLALNSKKRRVRKKYMDRARRLI